LSSENFSRIFASSFSTRRCSCSLFWHARMSEMKFCGRAMARTRWSALHCAARRRRAASRRRGPASVRGACTPPRLQPAHEHGLRHFEAAVGPPGPDRSRASLTASQLQTARGGSKVFFATFPGLPLAPLHTCRCGPPTAHKCNQSPPHTPRGPLAEPEVHPPSQSHTPRSACSLRPLSLPHRQPSYALTSHVMWTNWNYGTSPATDIWTEIRAPNQIIGNRA
jgi:hypothetical protein